MAAGKLKLLYLAKFLSEQTDEEHPASMQEILAYLESVGISAERKAIYDDLRLLEEFGLDVVTVRGKGAGYFLGERSFQTAEVKMLIDLVQASPFLSRRKSLALISKLEGLSSRYAAQQLRRQVYVLGRSKTENESIYYAVDGISEAIRRDRKIRFRYFDWTVEGEKQYRREGGYYTVNPVALTVDKNYYLIAYDAETAEYRQYRLDRMSEPGMTEEKRDRLPEDFDLSAYVSRIFDMYSGREETVTLRFENRLLNTVLDRFGGERMLRRDGEEHFIITAKVETSPTFLTYLAGFGGAVKVVQPESLRQRLCDLARETLLQYEE